MKTASVQNEPETVAQPALWHEKAPRHFDLRLPCWLKVLMVVVFTVTAILFLDQPVTVWAKAHPIPDLVHPQVGHGDVERELMFLEQWGQVACSTVVVLTVGFLDRAGRRKALALGIACLLTAAVTHLLKDMIGRSRPYIAATDGSWIWGGPAKGFLKGSRWGSFPSAHTTGAFALAAGLSWFYPRGRVLFFGLALITAAQRVLHTAHYVSDVIAGMGIGILVAQGSLRANIAGKLIALSVPRARAWWLKDYR